MGYWILLTCLINILHTSRYKGIMDLLLLIIYPLLIAYKNYIPCIILNRQVAVCIYILFSNNKVHNCSFVRKDLCEARTKPCSVFKNWMTFLHLGRWTPPDKALGQVDIWSDVPPRMRLWVRLTFGQIWSGWPLVRCNPRMRLWVRLTFGQTLGQVDIWSDVPPGWGFGSGWHLVRCTAKMGLRIRSTFDQMAGRLAKCSWLAGWPCDKMSLVYWCKSWTPLRSDIGSGCHFVRWLVGWPIAAGWLTDHLTKCQPDLPQDLILG